jgi:hypothetical protein
MGEEAVKYARSYAMGGEAERKMGQLIIMGHETGELASQKDGRPNKYSQKVYLSELGLTLKESSEAQKLAMLLSFFAEVFSFAVPADCMGDVTRLASLFVTHRLFTPRANSSHYRPPTGKANLMLSGRACIFTDLAG